VRFFAHVQSGPGAHPASCTMGTGSFPGVKRPGHGADRPPPSSAEVKKEQSYTSTHHLRHFRPLTGRLYLYIYLLIMLDTLLLTPSLHFTTLHPTTLHYTSLSTLHFLSFKLHFTSLHLSTLHFLSFKLHYTTLVDTSLPVI
jgi:hypothetical protein